MEARLSAVHFLQGDKLRELGGGVAAEVEILRVHVASDLVVNDRYVNPPQWSPLIYNFRHKLAETELGKTFRAEV